MPFTLFCMFVCFRYSTVVCGAALAGLLNFGRAGHTYGGPRLALGMFDVVLEVFGEDGIRCLVGFFGFFSVCVVLR